ncbi:multisubunit sodium/proton antiporter, MrpA subunit /multisubunit sodium/proton antiporter, MrpB subunit [Corynebacterium appendicis CIP 107643]|uniref:Multisubunit sodium/proton antiporter, MrpA subunit /multisubunit sodium/proton antiporter, MrpB subunit n=1 Tax=Corynebacterium appendicis CIP 107643 TaxID=1161099 RepID=A0A1N7IP03_9CORY|nr:DUF4040 family protein [Corynebacterium appendicis]WJY60094.1 Na(+)/H(+) antiporter subunit A [Corynebacterium appendicis CIP 107643]SIS38790.1 multisubunit sodium/proton antiporter, MrpA subunit /multisubunit sodium/proton antiporter, MrpB subunit [Corynebacterium appendicis CIP 107643]
MALLLVFGLVAATVVLSPVLVRAIDRRAGWVIGPVFFVAAGILANAARDGATPAFSTTWANDLLGPGTVVELGMRADGLSLFFALLALGIGGMVMLYSAAYLPENDGNTSFYTIMTAFSLSVLLLVTAGDVVVLFIGWELVSIASFLLIARSGSSGEAGSFRTLALTFFGGLTLLAGLAVAAVSAGTTQLDGILTSDVWADNPRLTTTVAVLIAFSGFTKAAQFPFHFWLPEAMAAATPVSAFLHAAAVVKAGVYLLLRFSAIFGLNPTWNVILVAFGLGTALMSAVFAITKTDLKHLTAYSTVSHLGWIVAAVGVGTPAAFAAALVHTLAHALFKSSLFMLIGVIDHETGTRDIRRLGKIYDKMPFTFASVVVAAASMAAVPPLFGFVSKESILEAFHSTQYGAPLLVLAGLAAFLTFVYSAKIVFGAFIDGTRDMSGVHEAPVALWLPAAIPGLLSVPVVFGLPLIDAPVTRAVHSITGDSSFESHLALWHGVTWPFIVSALVLVAGIAFIFVRKPVYKALENKMLLPYTGNEILRMIVNGSTDIGRAAGAMANSYDPSRHLKWPVGVIVALGLATMLFTTGVDGVVPAPRTEGLTNYWDLLPLLIIVVSVVGMMATTKRMTAALLLGTTGVGVSLQMLLLGAPDVALTQFTVEALTVVVIMMVLRYQPRLFPDVSKRRKTLSAIFAVVAGVVAFAGVYALTGRQDRSELAMWYLNETGPLTGGDNIVAVILVEFRSFDTLGELSVLGMAAVVIAAVTTSVPRHDFQEGTRPAPFGQSRLNTLPLRKVTKLIVPILVVLSVLIFFRGHTVPGGGFIAALVMATAFVLSYLSQGSDDNAVGEKTPVYLAGVGVIVALTAGFIGFIEGGFLYAIHGEIAGEHMTTSLIFDAGIYLAVLGMLTMAINGMGGYLRPGADHEQLDYHRSDENPLPDVPTTAASEQTVDPRPQPINPASEPVDLARAIISGARGNPSNDKENGGAR